MQFTSVIKMALKPKSGMGANGQWQVQEFILEEQCLSEYKQTMKVEVFNRPLLQDFMATHIGSVITASISFKVSEGNGTYFQKVVCLGAKFNGQIVGVQPPVGTPAENTLENARERSTSAQNPQSGINDSGDDLPF